MTNVHLYFDICVYTSHCVITLDDAIQGMAVGLDGFVCVCVCVPVSGEQRSK